MIQKNVLIRSSITSPFWDGICEFNLYVPGACMYTGLMKRENPRPVPMLSVTKLMFNRLMLKSWMGSCGSHSLKWVY